MEPFFLLAYYLRLGSWSEYMRMPISYKYWLIKRTNEENKKNNSKENGEENASSNNSGTNKNSIAHAKALMDQAKTNASGKLQKF